jgi:hypothetical protein
MAPGGNGGSQRVVSTYFDSQAPTGEGRWYQTEDGTWWRVVQRHGPAQTGVQQGGYDRSTNTIRRRT